MTKKPAKYHLEIQKHRKNPYGLLRSSCWKNGKVLHDTICRIKGLSLEQLQAMQAGEKAKALALRVLADRIESETAMPGINHIAFSTHNEPVAVS